MMRINLQKRIHFKEKRNRICILQEMYLRYFNKINKNDKIWFLSPQKSSINKIEKIHI